MKSPGNREPDASVAKPSEAARATETAPKASFRWPLVGMLGIVALVCGLAWSQWTGNGSNTPEPTTTPVPRSPQLKNGAYHVYENGSIQEALELTAANPDVNTVKVHSGIYRPQKPGQALVWFNARHDGITLEAEGNVVLTAENEALSDPKAASHPAIVNHVVYFGDGISRKTVFRGFTVTGANGFVVKDDASDPIQPDLPEPMLEKALFFYADGGGIKIFGRSYPVIENVEISNNYASPCGGGVSVEHRSFTETSVLFHNCIFRNNRCQVTGSALDILKGSTAVLMNCLFVDNIANMGEDFIGKKTGNEYNKEHGSGALTVFPGTQVHVERCTFTGNWNGVDDKSKGSRYVDCIFWKNDRPGGISPSERYEMDIRDGSKVHGCFIGGGTEDLRSALDATKNTLDAPDPKFDDRYIPQNEIYENVGFRPL